MGIAKAPEHISIDLQRTYFTEARQALKNNDIQTFQELRNKLQTYPLTPYLDIWQAHQSLANNNDAQVEQALSRHHDIPETIDLRIAWMKNLAERGQWPHVASQLKLINNATQNFPKISLRSAWYNGDKELAFKLLSKQWRNGKEIHTYAIPFLSPAWKEAGFPNAKDSYARIIYFAKRGKWKSVHALQYLLSNQEQKLLKLWQYAQKKPALGLLDIHKYTSENKLIYPIIKDTLRRLSSFNIEASWQQLKGLKESLTTKQFGHLQRKIALRAAKQHNRQAATWLASLSANLQNDETRAWHVRILLLQQKWPQTVAAIQAMPESQRLLSRWMYWQAHALQALDQNAAAKLLFEQIAIGRGYYSFLSADRLGETYNMSAKPIKTSSFTHLKKEAYIQRAYEWFQLHETGKASREWNRGLRNASQQTWLQALQLAASWGWYDRIIQAATRTGAYDALSLRFPLGYLDDVQHVAKQTGVKNSLIWSVIRQESVFNSNAVSHRGARGLMQLMPTTADYISKKSGLGKVPKQELFLPPINIQLGSLYLADLLKRFDNQPALAIAAYNAGPARVKRWQKQTPINDMNIWVELIPFNETRRYVQQVIAFTAVYDWRLQQLPSG
ncbi:MAG: lytic transglycosylase domain-containing protein [Mariprofundaceae bacterium]|nr:lytic transglycosylase domain-containing protein [Mariprofundaceae bacterium]